MLLASRIVAMAALLAPPLSAVAGGPVSLDAEAPPPEYISALNLFKDAKRQVPNDGVIPYDLTTPHFADYAALHRFIWLPEDSQIRYDETASLEYPIGAAVILTVGYPHDLRDPAVGERIVETRLFVRRREGWTALQYIWNEDTTDARLKPAGGAVTASWLHYDGEQRNHTFRIPNRNQCNMCHEIGGTLAPLGPMKADYLNKDYAYESGAENQLAYWSRNGILAGAPNDLNDAPRSPVWDDPETGTLDERARAYLDMNCSSCHRPGGIGYTSGLDLRYTQREPTRYGVYKAPVAAGRGGHARFAIVPGKPEESMLLHRLESTDAGVRMPVVGRGLVHEEGVALIRAWIAQMEFPQMAAAQAELDALRIAGLNAGAAK